MKAILLIGILVSSVLSAGQVRLLAVVDRHQPDVGPGCEKTFQRLRHFLMEARKDRVAEFDIYEWKNVMPTPGDILNHYRSAKFEPDDVLWFYYCGHGAMVDAKEIDPEKGIEGAKVHVLKMSQGDLPRSELREVMEARKTRGVIITTDACNTPGKFEFNGPVGQGAPPIPIDHWHKLRSLFDNSNGTIDFTAASGNSKAFMDPEMGANFTSALIGTLQSEFKDTDLDGDGAITWPEVFASVRYGTRFNFFLMKNRVALEARESYLTPDDKDQVPFAYSLGRPAANGALAAAGAAPAGPAVRVPFVMQVPWSTVGNEEGVRFLINSEIPAAYEGRTIQYLLSFWNARGEAIPVGPGSRYLNYFNMKVERGHLGPNHNFPWEIFINDRTVVHADPIWVKLVVFDLTEPGKSPVVGEKVFQLVSRKKPFGPREE